MMGLHIYRRGEIYWWRTRFTGISGPASVAFSLNVSVPAFAKLLGASLDLEALRLRRISEHGGMEAKIFKTRLLLKRDEDLERFKFEWTPGALAQLAKIEGDHFDGPVAEHPDLEEAPDDVSLAAVAASLRDDSLIQASRSSRRVIQFDGHGLALGLDNEINADAVMAIIYRRILHKGASADLSEADEVDLQTLGRSECEISMIRNQLRQLAVQETRTDWALGPSRREIEKALIAAAIQPSLEFTHIVRREVLLRRAELLEKLSTIPRFDMSTPDSGAAVAGVKQSLPSPISTSLAIGTSTPSPASGGTPLIKVTNDDEAFSFTKFVEDFIVKQDKLINTDTQRQYRSIAALFKKIAETDDVRLMLQKHIGAYFNALARLPKSYGKSPRDELRTIEEVIALGEQTVINSSKPRHEIIGRDPPTINRHATQLGALLKYIRGCGHTIGDISLLADFRQRDPEPDENKRKGFDAESSIKLFCSSPWNGCAGEGKLRLMSGQVIIHDSLYFAPIHANYAVMSLSEVMGIMLDDIDLKGAIPVIELRPNELRDHMKTWTRKRRQPIHPELIRLGFSDYVDTLRSLGFRTLWPDILLRGQATDMGDLFDKKWAPALDAALPDARQEKMTFQSFRKNGNTLLTEADSVKTATRYQLMGHKPEDVNGKHYTSTLSDRTKLDALMVLPIVTGHLQPAKIKLTKSVLEFAAKHPGPNKGFLI